MSDWIAEWSYGRVSSLLDASLVGREKEGMLKEITLGYRYFGGIAGKWEVKGVKEIRGKELEKEEGNEKKD